ncbi:MAG: S46 family peptidase [Tannerella sp.]|jgi:hypothetical protein|nr:S46 family peptidase [Tannerella sp.]
MKQVKKVCAALLLLVGMHFAYADEGMWVLKELNARNLARMRDLGFEAPFEQLYSDSAPCVANAVVIFGGGCTGITVSGKGLVFTNHHCGYGALQKLSSVTNNYLRDGFVSQSVEEEIPVSDLSVYYLKETIDVSDRIMERIAGIEDEFYRILKADSIGEAICDSIGHSEFLSAEIVPFYSRNKYFIVVYDIYRDVRLVFAPPGSVGKFGGDTDNWMWPRHTGDFSVFRVYADADNRPAEYSADNRPYKPEYFAEISLQGYEKNDYAMTLGFPGSTFRYLCSWGVEQRMEDSNKPRIEVRGIKQDIWKESMAASDDVRIKYASKYAGSANYWKNSIGMNRGLERLHVVARKKAEEKAFTEWVDGDPERKAKYGHVMEQLEKGYTASSEYRRYATYLTEAFAGGAEIIRLARMVYGVDMKYSTPDEISMTLEDEFRPFFKDYERELDCKVLAAMMKIVKSRLPAEYLPDIYPEIDRKYKGDYEKYANDMFRNTSIASYDKIASLLRDKKQYDKVVKKDPAIALSMSAIFAIFALQQQIASEGEDIEKGERLYLAGLQEMYPEKTFYSDANFTMRLSYGSINGYRPFDATWYDYYTTEKGVLEKEDATNDEFYVQPEILDLLGKKDFAPYGNEKNELQLCFLTNNDITGGNSGSPILDKHNRLIGLAFDGNWEAMSGDIAFEPELQRCIGVDIRYVLYLIDRWGKCPRLIEELKLVKQD